MKFEYYSKLILKDKTLPDATKCVANHLIHISGWEEDSLLPSNHKLEEILSIDRKTIIQAIRTLTDKGYILINDDNTFTFNINGIKFTKQNLKDPEACRSLGDFVKVPSYLNYINTITPSARIAAIMFFEFNFGIEGNTAYVKRETPSIDAVATYYGINKSTFKSRIQKCKEAEIFEYKIVNKGREERKVIGLKNIEWVKTWIRLDKLSSKTKKLQEEASVEQKLEEELIPSNDVIETMTKEEVEGIISKCDTQINTNKTLRNLSEGQYNYFITVLKGRDDLPITLRRYK
jgi:DNA-binding transcriptional regulator YhcF (GntR family)